MDDFIKNIKSPHWWLAVVVVSVVLSIFSSYAREGLDKILVRFSSSFRAWKRRKIAEFTSDV